MNLTPENIQFIDTYLKNSEVMYADIRSEMTDHIATAVEKEMAKNDWGFLVAFKDYMARNKKELMKINSRNMKSSMAILKNYFSFLIKPWMIGFAFVNFFVFMVTFRNYAEDFYTRHDFYILPLIWMLIILIPQSIVYIVTRKRFYYIEKSGFIAAILYQISLLLMLYSEEVTAISIAWCTYISIGYVFYTMHNVRQFYIKRLYTTIIK